MDCATQGSGSCREVVTVYFRRKSEYFFFHNGYNCCELSWIVSNACAVSRFLHGPDLSICHACSILASLETPRCSQWLQSISKDLQSVSRYSTASESSSPHPLSCQQCPLHLRSHDCHIPSQVRSIRRLQTTSPQPNPFEPAIFQRGSPS